MPAFISTCSTQYPPGEAPPAHCPVCEDERQDILHEGSHGRHWNAYGFRTPTDSAIRSPAPSASTPRTRCAPWRNPGTFSFEDHPTGSEMRRRASPPCPPWRSMTMSPNLHTLRRAEPPQSEPQKPGRAEVEAAVRTIIRWTGEDPERDGLIETPARVTRSYEEFFSGYGQDPVEILEKTFEEIEGYDEMVVLRDIGFESHCEHHMAPIIGRAWVAYIPKGRVVGISKLARVVDVYARRLQIQEKMTAQIANTIDQ